MDRWKRKRMSVWSTRNPRRWMIRTTVCCLAIRSSRNPCSNISRIYVKTINFGRVFSIVLVNVRYVRAPAAGSLRWSWSSFFPLGKKGHSGENCANIWFRHLREDVEERQIKSVQYLLWLPLWRQSATFILLQLLCWTGQTNDLVSQKCYLHWRIRPAMCSIIPARE